MDSRGLCCPMCSPRLEADPEQGSSGATETSANVCPSLLMYIAQPAPAAPSMAATARVPAVLCAEAGDVPLRRASSPLTLSERRLRSPYLDVAPTAAAARGAAAQGEGHRGVCMRHRSNSQLWGSSRRRSSVPWAAVAGLPRRVPLNSWRQYTAATKRLHNFCAQIGAS